MQIFGNKAKSPSSIFYYGLLDALFYCTIACTNFAIELTMILLVENNFLKNPELSFRTRKRNF